VSFFPTYQSFLQNLFFPSFTAIVALATLILIPRYLYKKYLIYGFITGALGDIILAYTLEFFNLITYKNAGAFNVLGLNFWAPISWMLVHMLFLYFLPHRRFFLYTYVLGFAMLSRVFSEILVNLNLFEFNGIWSYLSILAFLGWYSGTAWFYRRVEDSYKIK